MRGQDARRDFKKATRGHLETTVLFITAVSALGLFPLFFFFFSPFFFLYFSSFFFFTQTQRAVFVFLRPCCFVAGKVSTKPGAVCRQQRAAPHHSPAAPHPLPALSPCCTQARACQEHRSCLQNTHVRARALQPHSKSSNSSSKPSHVHVRVFFSPEKLPETCRLQ